GLTWGVAYEVTGEAALKYLNEREVTLGGYTTELVTFYPRDRSTQPFPYDSNLKRGHNVEYLVRLADFMREKIPEEYDEHLSTLETLVRNRIKENNMCLKSLMGEGPPSLTSHENGAEGGAVAVVAEDNNNNNNPQEERRNTFSYSTQVPKKTLRF
ncbi:Glutathione-specific gamma-glutamylcyclotransferase 1, partial [Armadillidium nasatum]